MWHSMKKSQINPKPNEPTLAIIEGSITELMVTFDCSMSVQPFCQPVSQQKFFNSTIKQSKLIRKS